MFRMRTPPDTDVTQSAGITCALRRENGLDVQEYFTGIKNGQSLIAFLRMNRKINKKPDFV